MTIRMLLWVQVVFSFVAIPKWGTGQDANKLPDATSSVSTETTAPLSDGRGLKLNEVQLIGTHNSYHIRPDAVAKRVIASTAAREADAIEYSHRPLLEQLDALSMRHFELDLYIDPDGTRYHSPSMWKLAKQLSSDIPDWPHESAMKQPGVKILHSPDFDYRSTVATFREALELFRDWSNQHPRHVPIFLLLELKSDSFSPWTKPLPWKEIDIEQLEKEILAVIPRDKLLAPDDLRGNEATLREAVRNKGWPTLESQRGKFVFLLDNEGAERNILLGKSETLAGRLLFASVSADHPAAAWMKRNDPVSQFEEIQKLVKQGFLVRTRADADTVQARSKDQSRSQKAIESGAQLISTDFPEPDSRFSDYHVILPFPFESP
ncbi:MAG: Ca2+-dependent phosphoinositide-specific phospholipase C [Pirellula sp.]